MEKNNLLITVDSITKDGRTHELIIVGWALDVANCTSADIQIENIEQFTSSIVDRTFRGDVNAHYHLNEEALCGFRIVLLPKHKKIDSCELHASSGEIKEEFNISLKGKVPLEPGIEKVWREPFVKIKRGLRYLQKNGLKNTIRRLKIEQNRNENHYEEWIKQNETTPSSELKKEAKELNYQPLISVLMPVYNVELKWLDTCIQSVQNQIYPNWELCICDDASTNPAVKKALQEYEKQDKRIKVTYHEENGHICKATNSALSIATGEFSALLDNDDELPPNALLEVAKLLNQNPNYDLIYSDEDKIDVTGKRSDPAFKPDWSPDLLLSTNYISHLGVYRTKILDRIGGFRPGYEGSQDYDLVLRFTEQTTGDRIAHIPKVLYHWRMVETSTAVNQDSKGYAFEAGRKALESALQRRGIEGTVTHAAGNGLYDVHYKIVAPNELVSIIIPTRDGYEDTKRCLESIYDKTTYGNYEIIMADNGSQDPKMNELYQSIEAKLSKDRFKVLTIDIPFNFSKINNIAAKSAQGRYLLFLNNDIEVITPNWLEKMVSLAQFDRIGTVGAKLYYSNNTIQHAGVIVGLGGAAGHGHHTFPKGDFGYFGRLEINVNYLALTAACVMIKKEDFAQLHGFEEELSVAYNDVDLGIRCYELGKDNVWLHGVELYHYESQTRGYEVTPEKQERLKKEAQYMYDHWGDHIKNDPFYSPNLTRTSGDYRVKV